MKDIEWYGHAGHFICARWCNFHLTTRVGDFLISTVGDYRREDHQPKPEEIGYGRLYETMVFKAGEPCKQKGCACGLPEIDGLSIEMRPYKTAGAARNGHMALVRKYAKIK